MSGVEARFEGRRGGFRLDATFVAPARGVTALYGPSGSGKTTLLRCLAGLERMHGRLLVKGQVWQDGRRFLPTHRRPIGYVFQETSLLTHLSVKGNLGYGLRRTRGEVRVGLDEVVDLLGLEPLLDRRPATVLLVTHNLREALALADRLLLLAPSPGRVVAEVPVTVPRAARDDATVEALRRDLLSRPEPAFRLLA